MAKDKGIQLTSDTDLVISLKKDENNKILSGLSIGNTLYQNQYLILNSQKGEFKEHPVVGVGISDVANDDELSVWKKEIRENLLTDGMKVEKLIINTSGMEIKAKY